MVNYLDSLPGSAGTILTLIGHDMIQTIVALCVESVLWALYIFLAIIASRILLRKWHSWLARGLLATLWSMVVLDTAMYFIDISNAVKEVSYTLTSSSDASLADRYALTAHLLFAAQTALYAFLCNLGDVIVVWRVHVFYSAGPHRWALALPLLLLAGSFAASGVVSYCAAYSIATGAPMLGGNFAEPARCRGAQLASYAVTLATTGVATLLISYKTWEYRRTVGKLVWLPARARTSRVERAMRIVVESGVLYFLFFLHSVIEDSTRVGALELASPGLAFAGTVWMYMTSHIVSIYPVSVIILVHTAHAHADDEAEAASTALFDRGGGRAAPLEVSVRTTVGVYGDAIPLADVGRKGKRFEAEDEEEGA